MCERSIFYRYPSLYIWGLKWIHKDHFDGRYHYMASFAKKGNSVLEPACGPAILANYLGKGVGYRGFDTNKYFIDFALKKHLDVYLGNVLDLKNYSPADFVIACDILHHLEPSSRKKFVEHCFLNARKAFIICEPGHNHKVGKGIFNKIKDRINEWSEKDGTNNVKAEHFLTLRQLLDSIQKGFGVIPASIRREKKQFGEDIVAVFFK